MDSDSLTFESLKSMLPDTPAPKTEEAPEVEEAPVEEPTEEAVEEAPEEEAEGEGEEEQEGGEGEQKAKSKDSLPRSKPFKVKIGDTITEIAPDATVKVVSDGKTLKVPLAELVDSYSGKKSAEIRYQTVKEEEKRLRAEKAEVSQGRAQLEQTVKAFSGHVANKKPFAAIALMAELAGHDPLETVRNFRAGMEGAMREYLGMSEIDRKVLEQQEEITYSRNKVEAERRQLEESRQQAQLLTRIDQTISTYGLEDREEFGTVLAEVQGRIASGALKLDGDLTPEAVGQYYVRERFVKVLEAELDDMDAEEAFSPQEIAAMAVGAATSRLDKKEIRRQLEALAKQRGSVSQAAKNLSDRAKTNGATSVKPKSKRPQEEIDKSALRWLGL
jgi:hypothetical protein